MARCSLYAMAATACALAVVPAAQAATPDSWRAGPSMAVGRAFPTVATLADGRILVVGGGASPADALTAELFAPQTSSFGPAASMHVSRNPPLAVMLAGGRVLVAGGDATGTTAEVYDPAADSWTLTANEMHADRGEERRHRVGRSRSRCPAGCSARRRPGPDQRRPDGAGRSLRGRATTPSTRSRT